MQELIEKLVIMDDEIKIITNKPKSYWLEKEKQMVIDAYRKGQSTQRKTAHQYYNENYKQ